MENIAYYAADADKFKVDEGYETAVNNWGNLSNSQDGFGWLFSLLDNLAEVAKGIKTLIGLA
ncbi:MULTISPECIES: hypothetical protein [Corynebacterium]|uniref:Uncharacterized protein n=2 Tax=Corynebacterium glucuronolyticum TaxID=39791 RepID=A0A7T4EGX1_9CORY|nr:MULTISPECIES: hypothetical protein [Corynebacterium]EEI26018.1 hypothetical protein HMPREF0294_2483 [Corynebacterium glucuronolyticum ATCC 51867]EEI64153.1 hypothetical protein HMPREF0293_0240 [Corynebacterium glucuronolyticum ATCC 51866]MCT1442025.1 hypothetical protein [Corynebacterium glucuronolyticum]MCT1563537.1 hypothetical protein [Corynebacterium glucuronolyticum]OFO46294.1 hypothetical protein HMPREF3044_10650 [Corynebacterium sp. HMSC073D01]